jgi:L-rhamnose mutarotase
MAMGGADTSRRVCLTFSLLPGAEAAYDSRHQTISPDLLAELRLAGFTESSVFRQGTSVIVFAFHPVDAVAALARVGESEANRRWGERFADLMATQPIEVAEVWHLDLADDLLP